jgi:hypothetical protein
MCSRVYIGPLRTSGVNPGGLDRWGGVVTPQILKWGVVKGGWGVVEGVVSGLTQ